MNRLFKMSIIALCAIPAKTYSQDIPLSSVPSLVINNFSQSFPKAYDIEWEQKGGLYKVEFETSLWGKEQEAWYERSGKLIEHKQEITRSALPVPVLAKINKDFNQYRIDDIAQRTRGKMVTFTVELKAFKEELKVIFDQRGNILSRLAD